VAVGNKGKVAETMDKTKEEVAGTVNGIGEEWLKRSISLKKSMQEIVSLSLKSMKRSLRLKSMKHLRLQTKETNTL